MALNSNVPSDGGSRTLLSRTFEDVLTAMARSFKQARYDAIAIELSQELADRFHAAPGCAVMFIVADRQGLALPVVPILYEDMHGRTVLVVRPMTKRTRPDGAQVTRFLDVLKRAALVQQENRSDEIGPGLRITPQFGSESAHEAGILSIAHRVLPDHDAVVGEEFKENDVSRRLGDVVVAGHWKVPGQDRGQADFVEHWILHQSGPSSMLASEATMMPTRTNADRSMNGLCDADAGNSPRTAPKNVGTNGGMRSSGRHRIEPAS